MLLRFSITDGSSRSWRDAALTPVDKAGLYTRIVLVAMYFSVDIAYVVQEMKTREELRRFAGVAEVPGGQGRLQFPEQVHC